MVRNRIRGSEVGGLLPTKHAQGCTGEKRGWNSPSDV